MDFKILISSFLSKEFRDDYKKRKELKTLDQLKIFDGFFVQYYKDGKPDGEKVSIKLFYFEKNGYIWYNTKPIFLNSVRVIPIRYIELN